MSFDIFAIGAFWYFAIIIINLCLIQSANVITDI